MLPAKTKLEISQESAYPLFRPVFLSQTMRTSVTSPNELKKFSSSSSLVCKNDHTFILDKLNNSLLLGPFKVNLITFRVKLYNCTDSASVNSFMQSSYVSQEN